MSKNLDSAVGLYMVGIRDGQPEDALERFVGARYTQHSTGVGNGKQGFLDFFRPFIDRTPDRDIRVLRTIEDGPYVFCHVFQSLNAGEAKWVTMDLFDTDADGRIVEHWDVITPFVETTEANEDMVGGPTEQGSSADTEKNKSIVKEYVKLVLTEGRHDLVGDFIACDYVQRNPTMKSGRDAMTEALRAGQIGACEMLFKLIGHGDFVVTLSKMRNKDGEHAVFDLYRLSNGLIVEHWDACEPILPRDQWGNSGKF